MPIVELAQHRKDPVLRLRARFRIGVWAGAALPGAATAWLAASRQWTPGICAAIATLLVVVSEPGLWTLALAFLPRESRVRIRQRLLDKERAERAALRPFRGKSGRIDPPLPVLFDYQARKPSPQRFRVRPERLTSHALSSGQAPWFRNGGLLWDGETLTITGDDGLEYTWGTLAPDGDPEPMTVAEIVGLVCTDDWLRRLFFLDGAGRRLATIPTVGLRRGAVAVLAQHAGLRFRVYAIQRGSGPARTAERMFGRSPCHEEVPGPDYYS